MKFPTFVKPTGPRSPQLNPGHGVTMGGAHREIRPQAAVKPRMLKQITTTNISAIDDLSGGGASPIVLVTLDSGDKLVVKREGLNFSGPGKSPTLAGKMGLVNANVKAMHQVMQVASPTSVLELLDEQEIKALLPRTFNLPKVKMSLEDALTGNFMMSKMRFDPRFEASSAKPVTDGDWGMDEKDKGKARQLFAQLRLNVNAWQSLGKIIIADAIIANNDRIDFADWSVTNFGNFIFAKDRTTGEITEALGYDTIDPSSGKMKNLYGVAFVKQEGRMVRDTSWQNTFGQAIQDKTRFPFHAATVMGRVNEERMAPLGLTPFGKTETEALRDGLIIGWDQQANKIGTLVRSGVGIPSGLMDRAKFLKWVR